MKRAEEDLQKIPRFKLLSIDTRETFLLVEPTIQSTTRSILTVCTVIFGGSLTFIGLRDNIKSSIFLKYSWLVLALSVVAHLFVLVATIDSLVAHGKTETDSKRALEGASEGNFMDKITGFFKNAFSSHYNQQLFFRSSRYLVSSLIIQIVLLLIGGALMGVFIWQNV
jgi:hypothetical protein